MYWNNVTLTTDNHSFRLTLTWDVLKWLIKWWYLSSCIRLTLTWDVLKYKFYDYDKYRVERLTLTWDVLKWILLMLC